MWLFQHFLALFETFTTLYNDPCIKLSYLANFDLYKPFLKKHFWKCIKGALLTSVDFMGEGSLKWPQKIGLKKVKIGLSGGGVGGSKMTQKIGRNLWIVPYLKIKRLLVLEPYVHRSLTKSEICIFKSVNRFPGQRQTNKINFTYFRVTSVIKLWGKGLTGKIIPRKTMFWLDFHWLPNELSKIGHHFCKRSV